MLVYDGCIEVPDVIIDYTKCNICMNCMRTCPMQVIRIKDRKVVQVEEICFGCKNCEVVCESDAIKVKGKYRVLKDKRKVGYIFLRAFPGFKDLAKDKKKMFQK